MDGERRPLEGPFPLRFNDSILVAMLASGLAGKVNPFMVMGCFSLSMVEEEGREGKGREEGKRAWRERRE